MCRQSVTLDAIEVMPDKGGFTQMQLELARKQSQDMKETKEDVKDSASVLQELKEKVYEMVSDVKFLKENLATVIEKLKIAETKYNFLWSILSSRTFWAIIGFLSLLVVGESAYRSYSK